MLGFDVVVSAFVHEIDYAADEFGHQVGLEGPRRICVADGERHVGHAGEHHALVGHGRGEIERLAVLADLGTAEQLHVQTRCGDDDVGRELLARAQLDAGLGEAVDGVGHHVGAAFADGAEQVAVGRQAQPLVPRVVAGTEMLVHVVSLGQSALRHRHQLLAHEVGEAPRDAVLRGLEHDALPPVDGVGRLGGEQLVHPDGERVDVGQRADVGRRALQHGHVFGARISQCGNESHRCGPTSDDDDPLAGVVEIFRPVLRMHDRALEVLRAGELR